MKPELVTLIVVAAILVALWDGVWKLIAMWKSARRNQLAWFICLAVFNTLGILPILYLVLSREPGTPATRST